MNIVRKKEFWIFALVMLCSIGAVILIKSTGIFDQILNWAQENLILFLAALFMFKVISVVYPPLTGGLFSMAAIPIIGWPLAFLADFAGSTIGGVINYYVGKKYGKPFVAKMLGEKAAQKIDTIKINPKNEIEGIILLRVASGSFLLELIHYLAGILNIKLYKYLIAIIISQTITGIPLFYLVGNVLDGTNQLMSIISLLLLIIGMPLLYKARNRYLE